jgi:hypothetical protein
MIATKSNRTFVTCTCLLYHPPKRKGNIRLVATNVDSRYSRLIMNGAETQKYHVGNPLTGSSKNSVLQKLTGLPY